jgi:ABC-type Na+ transport system ATPase subunit NatA
MDTIYDAKILLVDDNAELLALLCEQLRGAGYGHIRTAQSCAAARICFAAEQPELMILDEPTNGLDIEATVEMREVILRLAKEKGVTFLVASHLAAEIEKMCDKVLVLYEGEMLSFDTKEEALRLNPSLEDYFLAKVRDKKGSVVL